MNYTSHSGSFRPSRIFRPTTSCSTPARNLSCLPVAAGPSVWIGRQRELEYFRQLVGRRARSGCRGGGDQSHGRGPGDRDVGRSADGWHDWLLGSTNSTRLTLSGSGGQHADPEQFRQRGHDHCHQRQSRDRRAGRSGRQPDGERQRDAGLWRVKQHHGRLPVDLGRPRRDLILSGSDNYAGGTNVEAGTLILASNIALPGGSSLTVGAGGVLLFRSGAGPSPRRCISRAARWSLRRARAGNAGAADLECGHLLPLSSEVEELNA